MEITVRFSETFKDVEVVSKTHEYERMVQHYTWDELETLVAQAQRLIEQRNALRTRPVLTDRDRAEMARDDADYCDTCGHFVEHDHSLPPDEHPVTPCGDYRCCIN